MKWNRERLLGSAVGEGGGGGEDDDGDRKGRQDSQITWAWSEEG